MTDMEEQGIHPRNLVRSVDDAKIYWIIGPCQLSQREEFYIHLASHEPAQYVKRVGTFKDRGAWCTEFLGEGFSFRIYDSVNPAEPAPEVPEPSPGLRKCVDATGDWLL